MRPTSSFGVKSSSIPACGRFSATTRRTPSSIATTAALLSAPRIVPPALRTTPSSTTGSSGPAGGTGSRGAQKKSRFPAAGGAGRGGGLDLAGGRALLERPADDEPGVREPLAIEVVPLVGVPVALEDDGLAVELACPRPLRQLDRLRAEPHRAAEVLDALLLRQQ